MRARGARQAQRRALARGSATAGHGADPTRRGLSHPDEVHKEEPRRTQHKRGRDRADRVQVVEPRRRDVPSLRQTEGHDGDRGGLSAGTRTRGAACAESRYLSSGGAETQTQPTASCQAQRSCGASGRVARTRRAVASEPPGGRLLGQQQPAPGGRLPRPRQPADSCSDSGN